MCFNISGHNYSGLEVVCFLVSLSPDHVHPSGGFSFNIVNLENPLIINMFFNNTSIDVCVSSAEWEMILLLACTV